MWEIINGGFMDLWVKEILVWDYLGVEYFDGCLFVEKFVIEIVNYEEDFVNWRRFVRNVKFIDLNGG